MAWDYNRSLKRIQGKWAETEGLEVTRLTKEMDLSNISLMRPKLVHGAHVYVDVPAFADTLGPDLADEVAREILRRLHLQAREITRICESDFAAAKVHFQGPKLHAVIYRPYNEDSVIVHQAALLAAAIKRTIESIANEILGGTWSAAAGVDIGDAVATMNGTSGDRELLFLGNPANNGAKIITSGITITQAVADLVPPDLQAFVSETASGTFRFTIADAELDSAIDDTAWGWSADRTKARLSDELAKWPLDRVNITAAVGEIDKAKLGLANNKLVTGVNLFADIDGFTAYIAAAAQYDADLVHAVRSFHVFRSEMRAVAVRDFGALRVQYQGDRMQAVTFQPFDDKKITRKATDIAAGINASVTSTLPTTIGTAALPVAIGLSLGPTLITRVGEHGQRDQVALGSATRDAVKYQQKLDGSEIGIDKAMRDLLPDELAAEFAWRASAGCYVASDLTSDRVERLTEGAKIDSLASASFAAPALIRTPYETSGRTYHP